MPARDSLSHSLKYSSLSDPLVHRVYLLFAASVAGKSKLLIEYTFNFAIKKGSSICFSFCVRSANISLAMNICFSLLPIICSSSTNYLPSYSTSAPSMKFKIFRKSLRTNLASVESILVIRDTSYGFKESYSS